MWNAVQHSYEELRDVLVDMLLEKETVTYPLNQFNNISPGVAEVLAR